MTRRALRVKTRHTRTHRRTHKRSSKRSSKRNSKRNTFGGAVYDPMKYDTFTVRYFQNLDLPASVQANLMGRLNLQLAPLSKAVQYALQISTKQMEECTAKQAKQARQGTSIGDEWKKCEGTCNTLITDAVNQEIGSTAFMLKLLADSVIRPDGKQHRLKIGLDPSFFEKEKGKRANTSASDSTSSCRLLTGRWKDDAPFLRLVLPTFKDPEKPTSGRLVMGFGPSASGKTYWAKTILGLLAQADDNFPDVFFAVDGGLVRESSAVYQLATEMAHCAGLAGFKNLHAGMFVTGDIKHSMERYLLAESRRVPVSLYVPETLGKCEFMVKGRTVPLIRPCEEYLKTFLDITRDDKWIGLLLWQHATAADHTKDTEFLKEYPGAEYQCAGCMESGKEREKAEGKPYEGHVYAQSMKNGRKYMGMAPGGRYEIHNAGRREGKSVMWDRSVRNPVTETFSAIMRGVPGVQYVDHRSDLYGTPAPMETYGYVNVSARKAANNERAQRAVNAQRATNAAEGTPEAAAKRLAALRMPSKAQQEESAAIAKRLTAERKATERRNALRSAEASAKANANAKVRRNELRNAEAAAAAYTKPEREASRAEKKKINNYSYSGNLGNLSDESMIHPVIPL